MVCWRDEGVLRVTKMGGESSGINMYKQSGDEDMILKIVVSMMKM